VTLAAGERSVQRLAPRYYFEEQKKHRRKLLKVRADLRSLHRPKSSCSSKERYQHHQVSTGQSSAHLLVKMASRGAISTKVRAQNYSAEAWWLWSPDMIASVGGRRSHEVPDFEARSVQGPSAPERFHEPSHGDRCARERESRSRKWGGECVPNSASSRENCASVSTAQKHENLPTTTLMDFRKPDYCCWPGNCRHDCN